MLESLLIEYHLNNFGFMTMISTSFMLIPSFLINKLFSVSYFLFQRKFIAFNNSIYLPSGLEKYPQVGKAVTADWRITANNAKPKA